MKKTIVAIVLLVSFTLTACSSIISSTHPTQEEWLEVYLTHKIEQAADLWRVRTAIKVAINSESKEILISMVPATGEEELEAADKDSYTGISKAVIDSVLNDYAWAKDYGLTVQYL